MIIRFLKQKFAVRRTNDDGTPIPHIWIRGKSISALIDPDSGKLFRIESAEERPSGTHWIGDQDEAALIDIDVRRVLAYVWHDGYAKYYPTVYVSPLRAVQISRNHDGFLVSLRSLPRCAMELIRLRSMDDAQGCASFILEGGS